jgi:fructose-bisphosphate aldolase class II
MAILETAQEQKSPVIIGASMGAIKYMGGVDAVVGMVNGLIKGLNITVPVALHLDHGSYEYAISAIKAGFSSVMYDGSHEKFDDNYNNIQKVLKAAREKNISVEAEVGTIGGEEDGIIGSGEVADSAEFKKVAELGVDALAAGINNIHGQYPKG